MIQKCPLSKLKSGSKDGSLKGALKELFLAQAPKGPTATRFWYNREYVDVSALSSSRAIPKEGGKPPEAGEEELPAVLRVAHLPYEGVDVECRCEGGSKTMWTCPEMVESALKKKPGVAVAACQMDEFECRQSTMCRWMVEEKKCTLGGSQVA